MRVKRQYVGTKPELLFRVKEIFSIHYFEYDKNIEGIYEEHDFWEMVYVDAGFIKVTTGNDIITLKHGEAYFHAPNELHNIKSSDEYSNIFIISFSVQGNDIYTLNKSRIVLEKIERDLISHILSENTVTYAGALDIIDQTQLIYKNDAAYGGEQIIKNLLEQLLIYIIRHNKFPENNMRGESLKEYSDQRGNEQAIVDEIINLLIKNVYGNISLNSICSTIRFSKSYAERVFSYHMGVSIIKYYNKLKINESKKLISEGHLSITEISEKLRYGSLHYFSRSFKNFTGMSPTKYTQSVKARGLL